jgi:hypothetical protein
MNVKKGSEHENEHVIKITFHRRPQILRHLHQSRYGAMTQSKARQEIRKKIILVSSYCMVENMLNMARDEQKNQPDKLDRDSVTSHRTRET